MSPLGKSSSTNSQKPKNGPLKFYINDNCWNVNTKFRGTFLDIWLLVINDLPKKGS